jgi:hypothetical protein
MWIIESDLLLNMVLAQASGERLFMGRRDGRLVQLIFKP